MNELKEIWRQNTAWQNISWIGNIILFLAMVLLLLPVALPYYIYTLVRS